MFTRGDIISHYEIIERLGEGGMGVVYRAIDSKLDREIALKFLSNELTGDEESNARFVKEAHAASSLNHPNLCTIHEIGEYDDDHLFIAMALYEGRTLKQILQEADGPLPVEEALDIACQIAQGLAAAHEKGIVHRDIKPANIMVDLKGRVVILDFGLAKLVGTATITRTGSTLGTIAYMSPEQASGGSVDASSDVWALGAVLYEMVTGRKPFAGDYDQAVVYNILNGEPEKAGEINQAVTPELQSVLTRMLEKDPAYRYQSADPVVSDLRAIQMGSRPSAPSTAKAMFRRRSDGQHRMGLAALLTVAVIAVALVGVGFWLTRSKGRPIDSIAVLPLANLSGTSDEEYFVDGMTEALITELSKLSALRVISRQSVMRFKNSSEPLKDIARELNVEAVVTGSVVRSANQVRVNAQLISAQTDENLWADSFDRNIENILVLHADVARAIASQIEVTITPAEQKRLSSGQPVNPQAYEEYLRGQFYFGRLSEANFEDALGHYERALEIDPDFALAYAGIARVWGGAALWAGIEPREANRRAFDAIRKAISLGDTLAETMQNLAVQEMGFNYDWDAAETAFRKSIEMNPNLAAGPLIFADLLGCLGRFEEAIAMANRGVAIDPLSSFGLGLRAWVLLEAGRYDEAIDEHIATLRIDPNFPLAHRGLWALYYREGDSVRSAAEAMAFYRAQELPEIAEAIDSTLATEGYRRAMAAGARAGIEVSRDRYVHAMHIARLYTYAGEKQRALDLLEKAYEDRFASMPALGVDLHWDSLREEPRFEALMRKMDLPTPTRPIGT